MYRLKAKAERQTDRARIVLGVLVLVAATSVAQASPVASAATGSTGRAADQPNIVLIQADDQTAAQFSRKVMPTTFHDLVGPGIRFRNYIVTTPQCCPARASLLTGQYAHNDGVMSNSRGYPGLVDKGNVLPVWLQQAGYNTIHVGKFMNGFWRFAEHPADVAPGWTDWRSVVGGKFGYYDYFLSKNGTWEHFGKGNDDYITRVLTSNAVNAVHRFAPRAAPFYLQLDEHAPHGSGGNRPGRCSGKGVHAAKPDPRDMSDFRGTPLPHPPSFNEKHMGDKPAFLKHLPRLDRKRKFTARQHWRCALASLVGVDRSVGSVYDAVKKAGELRQTVFIYISDNGLFHGQHRLANGKVLPYDEALQQPLVLDIPSRYRSSQGEVRGIRKPVANIDLAPTMLDLAHGSPCPSSGACRTMDGRSLMPLVNGTGQWPHDRGLLAEYRANSPRYQACQYDGIRTRKTIYVEYHSVVDPKAHSCEDTFQVERYDLKRDPFELKNLCHGGTIAKCPTDAEQESLEQRLQQLSQCAGIAGRDEQVNGRPFCE